MLPVVLKPLRLPNPDSQRQFDQHWGNAADISVNYIHPNINWISYIHAIETKWQNNVLLHLRREGLQTQWFSSQFSVFSNTCS